LPGPLDNYPSVDNPFGIDGARSILETLLSAGALVMVATLFAGIASLVVRYRRSRGTERQQLKWFVYGAAMPPLALLGNDMFPNLSWLIGGVGVACIPAAIGIAVLRYRLYDIDVVINRTLVYGALTACVVGIYVFVVGYLGALFRTGGNLTISLVATGIVAVLFAPLRDRLQRAANRLMYGERDDPYAVLSRLGRRLETTLAPEATLRTVVEIIAQALKLPYAAINLKRDDGEFVTAARYGEPADEPITLPLAYGSEPVGQLILSPRSPGEAFSSSDKRLLDDLARQAGVGGARRAPHRRSATLPRAAGDSARRRAPEAQARPARRARTASRRADPQGRLRTDALRARPRRRRRVAGGAGDGHGGRASRYKAPGLRSAPACPRRAGVGRRHPRGRRAV
jgi:hypothetical protein